MLCSGDGLSASIFGTATIDGAGSVDYRIDVTDNGEPGSSDTYQIRLSNGYHSGLQTLVGGNVQIHQAKGGAAAAASASGPTTQGHRWTKPDKATAPVKEPAAAGSAAGTHKPDKPKTH